jgi:hypothetical protein
LTIFHYHFPKREEDPMSQLAALLKEYFERSPYKTVTDLTEAAQAYAPMSKSYVAHILRGDRQNPAYDKLMAIAYALKLDQPSTNRLLEAAGLPVAPPANPQVERLVEALQGLAQTPGVSPASVRLLVDGLLLMVEAFKAGLGHLPPAGVAAPPQSLTLRSLPAARLTPEEGLIDDLLGEILSRGETHPLDALFQSLEEAARGEQWEVKRRAAEALPRLVQLQPEATLRLAALLRQDYHPDYRADIRRRVVEAAPLLYPHRPQEALQLLASREQDEIYMAMAAVEVLHDMESSGLINAEIAEQYFQALEVDGQPARQQPVIQFLHQLLSEAQTDPDLALATMNANRAHPERIFRICIQRTAPRLLARRPDEALALIFYFLRRDEAGRPAEHQNLRRPVSRALPDILELLAAAPERQAQLGRLLQLLAQDPDIHVRRALGDALDRLAVLNGEAAVAVLDDLIEDQDPYVRQRAWRSLLQLADLYPEQAARYYERLLTAVS